MKKRILVFDVNISGMNKFLYPKLEEYNFELIIKRTPIKKIYKYWAALRTLSFDINVWQERFDLEYWKYYYHPDAFLWRTKQNEKIIKKCRQEYDFILQFGTMFAPSLKKTPKPYFVFTSWTTKLSDREWPEWNTLKDKAKYAKWEEWQNFLYKNATKIFVTNEYVVNSFLKDYNIPREKIKVVGYGPPIIPPIDFEKHYDGKTVLFIGYQFERKGGKYLLEAFRKVKREIPDARLIIIGPAKIDFRFEGIDFRGIVRDRNKIIDAYKETSIFTMPSICEPFGLTFLEAMAYKLPCIGTTNDAMPEIIIDGVTGYTVPPADADSLASRIVLLLRNPELMKTLGDNGYKRLNQVFTWDNVVRNIEAALDIVN